MRLAFLGCGAIAVQHARAARELGCEIAAACARSSDSPRWRAFSGEFPGARLAAGPAELLADPTTEAVVACLSWEQMPIWLEPLLDCPKPVLLEKPVALEAAPLRRALSARPGPRSKWVAYNRRFYEPVLRLKERLALGGLKSAEVVISEDVSHHVSRQGPGITPHLTAFSSCHSLDLALHLLGPLRLLERRLKPERGSAAPFVSAHALLETPAGAPVWLALNADDPSPAGLRLRFDDGETWTLSPLETLRAYRGYSIEPAAPPANVRRFTPKLALEVQVDGRLKPGLLAQMRAFLSGGAAPLATLEEALAVLDLLGGLFAR